MTTYIGTSTTGTPGVSSSSTIAEDASQFTCSNSGGNAITATQSSSSGTCYAVKATAATSSGYAVYASNTGFGPALYASAVVNAIDAHSNDAYALNATSSQTAISAASTSTTSGNGISATTAGPSGSGIYATNTGGGVGGSFSSNTTTSTYGAVVASNASGGNAIYATSSGSGTAVVATSSTGVALSATSSSNSAGAINATTNGNGHAIAAGGSGSGSVLLCAAYGLGPAISAQSNNGSPGLVATSSGYGVEATGQTAIYAQAIGSGTTYGIESTGTYSFSGVGQLFTSGDGGFGGNLDVSGSITKSGGGFLIDHPLDPANKYLCHSFVESPDRKNVYDGVAVADANGNVTVAMPAYFSELNEEYRYQLTPLDRPAPNLHIQNKIKSGRFSIAGAEPGQEISWQVTGVRKDPWAKSNPLLVEEDKRPGHVGNYRNPEAYGLAASESISMKAHARPSRSMGDEAPNASTVIAKA